MNQRQLGKNGPVVSAIGLGSWECRISTRAGMKRSRSRRSIALWNSVSIFLIRPTSMAWARMRNWCAKRSRDARAKAHRGNSATRRGEWPPLHRRDDEPCESLIHCPAVRVSGPSQAGLPVQSRSIAMEPQNSATINSRKLSANLFVPSRPF
jgi:hypothetical protein